MTADLRLSMSDRIRAVLEQRIVDGTLQPGDRLVELNLAKEFGASQTPVREALKALENQRLIETGPYRGTYVRGISDREMEEAYHVRGALEQLAAELAAPKLKNNVAPLRAILADLYKAARQGDPAAYSKHNLAFHLEIVRASGNQLLVESWEALNFETRVRILLSRSPKPDFVERAREHDPIVDALEKGDGKAAGKLLKEHGLACLERWCSRDKDKPAEKAGKKIDAAANCLS
ncbi:GntR family transcriptional regulator [Anatilimnocola floriformis]|uniref:GntR family transcriptional regulator n=1 Tax=Anatilimnocola floriformis TaxID=2948575 RepID=UPI0020C36441|nr:GntR family transcriptional regulator [Anatilimnocola floriformis]